MRPTKRHMKVDRYVEPAEFERWKQVAEDMGFLYVASGPLVRSSYKVRVLKPMLSGEYLSPNRPVNFTSRIYCVGRELRIERNVTLLPRCRSIWVPICDNVHGALY